MKNLFLIFFFLTSSFSFAQTPSLRVAVGQLDDALVQKDSAVLNNLLHADVSYGHTNGWVQKKQDVIHDLFNGKLRYEKIESFDHEWNENDDWASVRSTSKVVYLLEDGRGEIKMHVLQVWLRNEDGWKLIARQSTKMPVKE